MNNVLELTTIPVTNKKIEGSASVKKLRLTGPTSLSLKENIRTGLISRQVEKYNSTYTELHNAVVSAEVALAEQEARDKALTTGTDAQSEAERAAKIEEDNTLAKYTSAQVVKRRFNVLKIDVEKLSGRFGTLGQNFGVNVKKGYVPKALSVPSLYSKIYSGIFKKSNVYKLADQLMNADPNLLHNRGIEVAMPVANWRSLFDGVQGTKHNQLNVTDKRRKRQETVTPLNEERAVTQEELSHRKLMGQLGDELDEIRKIQTSSEGVASPFNTGLIEREDSLLSMLSNLSGVESIASRKMVNTPKKDNTEFQNLIDRIVGYQEPISDEEHKKEEARQQEYYSNPEVSDIIDKLRHKDMLFTFNQPEVYQSVMEAERLDNEKSAQTSKEEVLEEMEILDNYEPTTTTESTLETPDEKSEESKKQEERESIIVGAEEQARLLQKQAEQDELILGAEEQARILQNENERIDLINGAEEQAQMLKTLYDFMDKQEEMEQAQAREREKLAEGAKEQAQMLQQANERIDLMNGAEEQAQRLYEEAKELEEQEEQSMEDVANQIVYQSSMDDDAKNGAEEQAQMIQSENEKKELVAGAKKQAQMLQQANERLDLIDGAKEQARMIQNEREREEIVADAMNQAQMIHKENERIDLMNGAEEQARMINDVVQSQVMFLEKRLGSNVQLTSGSDRYGSIVSPSKPIKLRGAQMDNMRGLLIGTPKSVLGEKKKILSSLKEQFERAEQEDLSFLKYNDTMVKAA